MEDNNQDNLQSTDQSSASVEAPVEEVQDPRLIHPIIIGELRKEKIGKPVMVIELFLLFGIVFAALPFINNMMTDENSFLYKLIHPGTVSTTSNSNSNSNNNNTKEEYLDGTKLNLLNAGKIKYKNIILQKISLVDGAVKCTISTYSGSLNLDAGEYYLEITATSGEVVAAVKLIGNIDIVEKEQTFEVYNVNFNSSITYQGRVVEMADKDYPKVTLLDVDERGYASLTCTKGNRTIRYGFQNEFLISINDTDNVSYSELSSDEYVNSLAAARIKAEKLGVAIANVQEVESGYTYTANINLENYSIPAEISDNNYYSLNTKAEKIAYAQKGKGYGCQ